MPATLLSRWIELCVRPLRLYCVVMNCHQTTRSFSPANPSTTARCRDVGNDYAPREQVRRKESVVKHGGEDFEDLFLPADKDPFGDIPPAAVKPEKEQARKKE